MKYSVVIAFIAIILVVAVFGAKPPSPPPSGPGYVDHKAFNSGNPGPSILL